MSRMIGYCLHLGTVEAWAGFHTVALARMNERERAMLAYFSLSSLAPENRDKVAVWVVEQAGDPLPAFLGGMEDARFWASIASINELKAYALACFEAMPARDRTAFYQHVSTIEVEI